MVVKQPKMPYRPEIDGYAALTMLLDADPEITGVLCFSDRFAAGVLAAALDRGLPYRATCRSSGSMTARSRRTPGPR